MTGFKLYSLQLSTNSIETERIDLIDDFISNNENYFSLIVGNNGTGKSRILSEIARYFKDFEKKGKYPTIFKEHIFDYNKVPSKVIAITNSISDKFPIDQSYRNYSNQNKEDYSRNYYYNYLGNRNKLNSFTNKALMNRALDIVFENYSHLDVSRNYRFIFDYLNYEPVIKLNYRIIHSFFNTNRPITKDLLKNFIKERFTLKERFTSMEFQESIDNRLDEIITFIEDRLQRNNKEYELIINFSEKNISRILHDNSLYSENVNDYEMLTILRKIGLIRSYKIQVFKKDGSQFNFSDASSGEASILSTLLALIPLLKDESLILIDEPEISLHPLWQSQYIDLLNKILMNVKGCHVIIASHSPFLVSDLKPQISSVITLKNRKGFIYSNFINKSAYGWSSDDILKTVFELKSTRNYELYENINRALLLLADNNRSRDQLIKIQNNLREFYPYLLDSDPIKTVIRAIFEANSNE